MTALHAALVLRLSTYFPLSKNGLLCLSALIAGRAQSRTVNLSYLASHLPGSACSASSDCRLQRFLQFVRLDTDCMARLVVQMLDLERPKCLALDRTNWKIGATDVNILMLAIVTRRFRIPVLWTLLPHQGNSDTGSRGLNLDDTRIRNPDKLSCLLVVVTLAMTWAYRCATQTMGMKAIKRKKHGRREKIMVPNRPRCSQKMDRQRRTKRNRCLVREKSRADQNQTQTMNCRVRWI